VAGTPTGTGTGDCADKRTGTVTINEHGTGGGALCLAQGAHLEIYLYGTADNKWTPPGPDNEPGTDAGVLQPEANGKGALALGVTAGFFRAARPGRVVITSVRGADSRFRLVVTVR
jgi:hypothetical protein